MDVQAYPQRWLPHCKYVRVCVCGKKKKCVCVNKLGIQSNISITNHVHLTTAEKVHLSGCSQQGSFTIECFGIQYVHFLREFIVSRFHYGEV